MSNFLTIDGGTTNTRVYLIKNDLLADSVALNVGARSAIEDKMILKNAIKNAIDKLLSAHSLGANDVKAILASGMITSESGLMPIEHISLPVGVHELAEAIKCYCFNEITPIPFYFVPGVKIVSDKLEDADMIRGEETEIMGIIQGDGIYVLEGSHSKIIKVKDGRIVDFNTMLTGEMISSLSEHTILKDSLRLDKSCLDREHLKRGFEYARKNGLNEALFKTRVLKNLFGADYDLTYSFFLGAILQGEVNAILCMGAEKVVISGQKQIKMAMAMLLEECGLEVTVVPEEEVGLSVVKGIIGIFKHKYGE